MDLRAAGAADASQLLGQRRDEDDVSVEDRLVIGHVMLADDPPAAMRLRPFASVAERLDVVDRHLLGPVQIDRVVDVAVLVELVLTDGEPGGVAPGVLRRSVIAHDPTRISGPPEGHENGAGDGDRTRDPNLGKVVLCQLSYSRSSRER